MCTDNRGFHLVVKLEGLATGDIDGTSTVGAALLLVLLLGESFATSDREICVSPVCVRV